MYLRCRDTNLQNVFLLQNRCSIPMKQQPPSVTLPQLLVATILLSSSTHLTPLDTSYEWSHPAFSFCDWFLSFSRRSSRFIAVVARNRIFSPHIYPTSHLSIHSLTDIWAASASWLLLNSVAIKMACEYFFEALLLIIWDVCPEIRLLDYLGVLLLTF